MRREIVKQMIKIIYILLYRLLGVSRGLKAIIRGLEAMNRGLEAMTRGMEAVI